MVCQHLVIDLLIFVVKLLIFCSESRTDGSDDEKNDNDDSDLDDKDDAHVHIRMFSELGIDSVYAFALSL